MARPRTERYWGDVLLAPNLYPDAKKRDGYWRYRLPDRRFRTFHAPTVQKANEIAEENNRRRERPMSDMSRRVDEFIEYREELDPKLADKRAWKNRKGELRQFANDMQCPANHLTRDHIKGWWKGLTYHQQKARQAEMRRLFSFLMDEGSVRLSYNPFTQNDDMPRLLRKGIPDKKRQRLTREDFWKIYAAAGDLGYEGLQIAMGLSLTTFMREGDICGLKLSENLESDLLKLVVGKSLAQKGSATASRLQWDVGSHQLVRDLLSKSRELSMKHYRCPFVISHKPKAIRQSKTKEHSCQILPRRLIAFFAEARTLAGVVSVDAHSSPPSFHEIRSLASKLAKDAGYNMKEIQNVMAHEREDTTKGYMSGHQLPFDDVNVVFDEEMIGGKF